MIHNGLITMTTVKTTLQRKSSDCCTRRNFHRINLTDRCIELMVFQIRRDDGRIDPFSSGTWIEPNGETKRLNEEQFEIQINDFWRSQKSGVEYPIAWRLSIPSLSIDLEITPLIVDQEMDVSYSYWEGAVNIVGTKNGIPISGDGYVEMTGYAASMEGQF